MRYLVRELHGDYLPSGNNHIQTASGVWFNPFHPRAEDIVLEDVAHALSMGCRFTGHVRRRYSVAEHVVNCARLLGARGFSALDQLKALHHDDDEAYLSDLSRPVKIHESMAGYREVQKGLMNACLIKFTGDTELPQSVHWADNAMLLAEGLELMPDITPWSLKPEMFDLTWDEVSGMHHYIQCLDPTPAAQAYLYMHYSLVAAIQRSNIAEGISRVS